ncbi:MAG: tyrosine-protein phosphatase [Chloroflexi bacterium]|nr:tyrosine-protein phosphatase [Chloroflexota bacterium]
MPAVIVILVLAMGLAAVWLLYRRSIRRRHARINPDALTLPQNPDWLLDSTGASHDRFLPIATAVNLRDIGGYPAANGKRVRWGRIYRSGTLSELSEGDVHLVAQLGLKVICDLRTEREAERSPDLPERFGARPAFIPLKADHGARRRLIVLLFRSAQMRQLVYETYTDLILEYNAGVIGAFLRLAADAENYPLLFHCSAGKDRTGAAAMVLFGLLGVPDEVIVADYSLSNKYHHRFREYVGEAVVRFKWMAITPDDMTPFAVADPAVLRDVIAELRRRYGSFEDYALTRCGIDESVIAALRANLLEE